MIRILRSLRLPKPKKTISGYHPTMSVSARHCALMKKIKKESALSVGRHLLLLSTLTKKTIPNASKVYKMNSIWVFKKLKKTNATPKKKKSRGGILGFKNVLQYGF